MCRGTRVFGAIVSSPILRDWLPCAASTRSDTSSPGADPSLVVTSCLVIIGTASSFHALPCVQGAQGAGCSAPPRKRASQTAIRSQSSRSQRSLRLMVDHFVTEVQATITAVMGLEEDDRCTECGPENAL